MEKQDRNERSFGSGGPSDRSDRGDRSGGDRSDRGDRKESRGGRPGGGFGRKKVDPFILDKALVLDYKNLRMVYRFVSETGRIVPRHISGVNAKNQRRLTKHIKRARSLGLIAPKIEG
jgi:small subunit ribosomal protein S18